MGWAPGGWFVQCKGCFYTCQRVNVKIFVTKCKRGLSVTCVFPMVLGMAWGTGEPCKYAGSGCVFPMFPMKCLDYKNYIKVLQGFYLELFMASDLKVMGNWGT